MSDCRILRLSDRWALAADKLQWIVQKRKGGHWRNIAFVASEKRILLRVLHEKGAEIDAAGQRGLDALPETFQAWRDSVSRGLTAPLDGPRLPTRPHRQDRGGVRASVAGLGLNFAPPL